jgi:TolB-like protein
MLRRTSRWPILPLAGLLGFTSPVVAQQKGPALAVFNLEAKTGVNPGTAEVLSDNMVAELRATAAFGHVVSAKEVESIIGFERQRQMMDCRADSCLAELAGSLGVDFILMGNLARLGASFLVNAKVLRVKDGRNVASVSARLKGDTEEVLLDAVRPTVRDLVGQMGLGPAPAFSPSTVPGPVSAPTATAETQTAALVDTPELPPAAAATRPVALVVEVQPAEGRRWVSPLRGALMAGGLVLLVVGVGAVPAAMATTGVATLLYFSGMIPGVNIRDVRDQVFVASMGGYVVAVAVLLLGALVGTSGLGAGVISLVVP